ncbi:hypothetical protein FN846DRAFT_993711 [Sphaerosporella brunnea]|uniref:Uncharacterized protein n=1 Tax=Sphaerosporella brunnea TaxID=1250544 RepID=A0A5J5EL77_9PEZI|nr:hypothetical protein FN846DRAFT_993711 [Sphaerosporella brunnea]
MDSDTMRHGLDVKATNQSPSVPLHELTTAPASSKGSRGLSRAGTYVINPQENAYCEPLKLQGYYGTYSRRPDRLSAATRNHFNKSVKQHITDYLEEKIEENWPSDFPGKANVRVWERRTLITHCVADALEKLHNEQGDVIPKLFNQPGTSLNPDGSEDHLLNVKDLPDHAKEIGSSEVLGAGGLNCNLELGVVENGRRSRGQTGGGLLQEGNWHHLLRLLDEKDAVPQDIEAKERDDDEMAVQVCNNQFLSCFWCAAPVAAYPPSTGTRYNKVARYFKMRGI